MLSTNRLNRLLRDPSLPALLGTLRLPEKCFRNVVALIPMPDGELLLYS